MGINYYDAYCPNCRYHLGYVFPDNYQTVSNKIYHCPNCSGDVKPVLEGQSGSFMPNIDQILN